LIKAFFRMILMRGEKFPSVISHLYALQVFLVDFFGKAVSFYLLPVFLGNSLNIKYTT